MTDPNREIPPAPTTPEIPMPMPPEPQPEQPKGEIGGFQGPEPTRFGDWAHAGRCSDF